MNRQNLILTLGAFRQKLEREGGNLMTLEAPAGLFLSDLCNHLGLSGLERNLVLGEKVARAVEEWETARIWQPVEEKGMAAEPVADLAAIPAS